MRPGRWLLLAGLAAAAGCASLAPRYARPPLPVPDAWPAGAAPPETAGAPGGRPAADVPWRDFFADERLRRVIALALAANRDLRVAALDVERSQALFRVERSALYPEVDASGGANYQRVPRDFSGTGAAVNLHQYTVGLGVSAWELDFFGRARNLRDAALERYLASEHARRSVRVSVVSQAAVAWLALAADGEQLRLARETLADQEASLTLVRARFQAGVSSALDVDQARTTVEQARDDLARFTALVAQDGNALTLAVGAPVPAELLPDALPAEAGSPGPLAPGLPSAVLLRRPDILEAEGLLKAANADVGAARAALFPSIALSSSAGFGSSALSGLFDGASLAWRFAPQVSLPIFDAGGRRAGVKVARADRELAVARYEQAVQAAFREVADALAVRATIEDRLAAQVRPAEGAGERRRLAPARYQRGVDSYLQVLDAQRALAAARQRLIATRLARLANQATLYKALGGGAAD